MTRHSRHLLHLERFCLGVGALGLLLFSSAQIDAKLGARAAHAAVAESLAEPRETDPSTDHSAREEGSALGLLRIERLGLEVPVLLGTSRRTLAHGAGLVDGTALPGSAGNVVVSAHRDSFFRPLEDIRVGDTIELVAIDGSVQNFSVAETFITDPLDTSVLAPTETAQLTLITCWPFRYVGFAPDRFIVRADQEVSSEL